MKRTPTPTSVISLIVSAAAKNRTAPSSWASVPTSPARWLSLRCARDAPSNGTQKGRKSCEAPIRFLTKGGSRESPALSCLSLGSETYCEGKESASGATGRESTAEVGFVASSIGSTTSSPLQNECTLAGQWNGSRNVEQAPFRGKT